MGRRAGAEDGQGNRREEGIAAGGDAGSRVVRPARDSTRRSGRAELAPRARRRISAGASAASLLGGSAGPRPALMWDAPDGGET
jgi:hypothetical protein